MKNKKYKVCRDNIYVGMVVKADSIYAKTSSEQLTTGICRRYRSILFVPTEQKFANDLLYRSPNYPILNITDEDICLSLTGKNIVIKRAYNLSLLLKHLGYEEVLDYKDILKIRKKIFSGTFAKDHCELFGMREIMAEDMIFYSNDGSEITDMRKIKRGRKEFRKEQKAGNRIFDIAGIGPIPREYWYAIDEFGQDKNRKNSFEPHKNEGHVKKLTRF